MSFSSSNTEIVWRELCGASKKSNYTSEDLSTKNFCSSGTRLLSTEGFPKKTARFSKTMNVRNSVMIGDGKIIESIDLEYLSNRAYFMGNPVAAILLRFNHSAILLPFPPGFRLCWKPFLVRWLSGISISAKFPHSVCPLAHSLGPVTAAALFNPVYLASLTSGPDSLPSRGGMYGQWAADLVGKKGGVVNQSF